MNQASGLLQLGLFRPTCIRYVSDPVFFSVSREPELHGGEDELQLRSRDHVAQLSPALRQVWKTSTEGSDSSRVKDTDKLSVLRRIRGFDPGKPNQNYDETI